MHQTGPTGRAFTSDLSGQEFWLVVDKGYQPLGLVLGNCVYSMGMAGSFFGNLKGNLVQGEVEQYSKLMYDARELALRRMQAEADALGADGVIGVDKLYAQQRMDGSDRAWHGGQVCRSRR